MRGSSSAHINGNRFLPGCAGIYHYRALGVRHHARMALQYPAALACFEIYHYQSSLVAHRPGGNTFIGDNNQLMLGGYQ